MSLESILKERDELEYQDKLDEIGAIVVYPSIFRHDELDYEIDRILYS